ncbi:MAG: hypothetical protein ACC628_19420 [Pirellulaceae bacterium]
MARMMLRNYTVFFSVVLAWLCMAVGSSAAPPPPENLLPTTTKSVVSIPDIDAVGTKWRETQFGKMVEDPVMKPFIEDLQRQFKAKLSKTDTRIGISWEDLEGIYGGEACVALIQPWDAENERTSIEEAVDRAVAKAKATGKDDQEITFIREATKIVSQQEQDQARQTKCAIAMLVDVTGHVEAAQEFLEKISRELASKGATRSVEKVAGINMVALTIPLDKEAGTTRKAYYGIEQDLLIATDDKEVAAGIVKRLAGDANDSLSQVAAYQATSSRCDKAFGDQQPQLEWFVEPFGLAEVFRAYAGGRKKRGTDVLKVLSNQGFKAIRGLGGGIALATGEHEILQHTFVFAPAVQRAADDAGTDKYDLAARMLDFPNSTALQPESWIPRNLATYLTFNWKMRDAFWYAETLVNEFAGDEVFEDVLKSIETDPNGPQINIEKELVEHIGQRATLIADCQLPITPKSERILFALEVTNSEMVMRTINKAMESDPEARKLEYNGHVIWEMINEDPVEVEAVRIDGPGFGFDFEEEEFVEEDQPFRPNAAVTVARGHMVIASHVDYIIEMLDRSEDGETLDTDGEYQVVSVALEKLGAGDDAFRFFTRMDEASRATYELLRQGRMPESESLFGKVLNYIFEPEEEGAVREQYLDGSKLPEYQVVRRYLGPGGLFVRTEEDGWSISGVLLTKEAE